MGMIAFWSTMSLNMPDFTRFGSGQRQQVVGQVLGLPTTMTFFSLLAVLITAASQKIYGAPIWDPIQLSGKFHSPIVIGFALFTVVVATLAVNVAANTVSPSYDFSNLAPRFVSFRTGGLITCAMGIAMQPWKLMANYGSYIFGWLVGYSGFLGPIAGVLICDYFVVRKKILSSEDLYQRGGQYEYSHGFNWQAIAALAGGAAVAFIGLLVPPLHILYNYAWFVGFAVSFFTYFTLMRIRNPQPVPQAAD